MKTLLIFSAVGCVALFGKMSKMQIAEKDTTIPALGFALSSVLLVIAEIGCGISALASII